MKPTVHATMHHIFAVKVLGRLPGYFKPYRYLYHCARCKWSFIVNDTCRGELTPIDGDGKPLAHDEAVARANTFAHGPCPAMLLLANVALAADQASNGTGPHRVDLPAGGEQRAN